MLPVARSSRYTYVCFQLLLLRQSRLAIRTPSRTHLAFAKLPLRTRPSSRRQALFRADSAPSGSRKGRICREALGGPDIVAEWVQYRAAGGCTGPPQARQAGTRTDGALRGRLQSASGRARTDRGRADSASGISHGTGSDFAADGHPTRTWNRAFLASAGPADALARPDNWHILWSEQTPRHQHWESALINSFFAV